MFAQVTRLYYWKTEHKDEANCQDACGYKVSDGLFVVSDGAGTTLYSNFWARRLVEHFLKVPLMSNDLFEVEWWVRTVQQDYKVPEPEDIYAQQKFQSQGSQATLATLRLTEVGSTSAKGELLAFGDSCVFIGRPDKERPVLSSFPLQTPAQFERAPICIPSKLSLFNRKFHIGSTEQVELRADDIVILATDAVSRWILSRGDEQYQSTWETFQMIASQTPETWPAFINGCREKLQMIDDDSTALIITLREQPTADGELGIAKRDQKMLEQRKQDFEKAVQERNSELVAVYFGDGADLTSIGERPAQGQIERAQKVADALKEVLSVLREELNSPNFVAKMQPFWDERRELLLDESCPSGVRNTLELKGVSLVPPKQPVPDLAPQESEKLAREKQQHLEDELKRIQLKERLLEALRDDDDAKIIAIHDEIQKSPYAQSFQYRPREKERVALAMRHMALLQSIRGALQSKNAKNMAGVYELLQKHESTPLNPPEIQQLELAAHFIKALQTDTDDVILAACNPIILSPYAGFLVFTAEENARIHLAQRRKVAFEQFQIALKSGMPGLIATTYNPVLDHTRYLSSEQSTKLALAHRFVEAFNADNDEAIVLVDDRIKQENFVNFFHFTSIQQERIALARRRTAMHSALKSKNAEQIAAAYRVLQGDFKYLSDDEVQQLELANEFLKACQDDKDEAILATFRKIQESHQVEWLVLTEGEQERLEQAYRARAALTPPTFKIAVINAPTIGNDWLKKVSSVKGEYMAQKRQLAGSREQLNEWSLGDLYDDPWIQAGIEGANRGVDSKLVDTEKLLPKAFEKFRAYKGQQYTQFLSDSKLTDNEVKTILLIFLRREQFAHYLQQRENIFLEQWLKDRRRDGYVDLDATTIMPAQGKQKRQWLSKLMKGS